MSPLLSNYSFLSPLKRQRAVRNRGNIVTPSPSKCANRLPVLPELSGEQDAFSSPSPSPSILSTSFPRTSPSVCPSEKRRSRYGRDEFALDQDFLRVATLDAHSPTPAEQRHQSVRLSAFDIVIDITAPTSPISDSPPAESSGSVLTTPPRPTRSRDIRLQSPPRSRSPTPSLTSMSACSSNDIPTTPLTSDDEWPGLGSSPRLRKAPAAQRVQIHPLVITRSTPDANPADVFEFTIAPFSDPEDGEEQDEDEDDVSWYARELGQLVSLASPRAPSASSATAARPDSLPPPSRASTRSGQHSRMSKPLPAIPRTPGPSPQLDPTFPRQRTTSRRPSRQPLPTYPLPQPPRTATTLSIRKSLRITVPRAPPRTPLPLDVADIFDDIDAWSVFAPSAGLRSTSAATSAGAAELSPPRMPHTPMSAYSQYDPLELIVDYATLPSPQPSPSSSMSPSPSMSPSLSSFLPDDDSDDSESEYWPSEEKLRSRWSCSTVATLATRATASPPTSPSPSARLRFHLGTVARRVRARRTGASGSDNAVPKTHARSSSEPSANSGANSAVVGVRSESGHEDAESCLRRKPIPLELFLR